MKNTLDRILFSQFAGFYSSKNIRAKKRKISLYWKTPEEKLLPGTLLKNPSKFADHNLVFAFKYPQ